MKKSRFSESQIISILKRNEQGERVIDLCREVGISDATSYNWKAKYGGMSVSDMKRLKALTAQFNGIVSGRRSSAGWSRS